MHISEPDILNKIEGAKTTQLKLSTIKSIPSTVVKLIEESEISDDYCE